MSNIEKRSSKKVVIITLIIVILLSIVALTILLLKSKPETTVETEPETEVIYVSDIDTSPDEEIIQERIEEPDYIEQEEKYDALADYTYAMPTGWEMPVEVYETLDQSMLWLLGESSYYDNIQIQYGLYSLFGEDLSILRCEDPSIVALEEGSPLSVQFFEEGTNKKYAVWIDLINCYIKEIK